jgi:hypothetical protein
LQLTPLKNGCKSDFYRRLLVEDTEDTDRVDWLECDSISLLVDDRDDRLLVEDVEDAEDAEDAENVEDEDDSCS